MHDVMAVINLSNERDSLNELTYYRNHASVPFGARYRFIDFTLSNMVNSGISDIAVLTVSKYRSLLDHLGTGRDWDLDRKRGGLFILPPSYDYTGTNLYGDLANLYQHLDFFIHGKQKYVIISFGSMITNLDYRPAFYYHQDIGADITMLYKELSVKELGLSNWRRINVANDGRILDIGKDLHKPQSNKVSLEMVIMEKRLLLKMIQECVDGGKCDLMNDGIISNLDKLNIFGFPYYGYLANIDSIESYYKHSMELLNPEVWQNLFYQPGYIYTKVKNDPPTKYLRHSSVKNSLIANGCIIEGTVENSIIFRSVKIKKGAHIKNSIIMQKSEVGNNALIENAILDKRVVIGSGKIIKGEAEIPFVIPKRINIK